MDYLLFNNLLVLSHFLPPSPFPTIPLVGVPAQLISKNQQAMSFSFAPHEALHSCHRRRGKFVVGVRRRGPSSGRKMGMDQV